MSLKAIPFRKKAVKYTYFRVIMIPNLVTTHQWPRDSCYPLDRHLGSLNYQELHDAPLTSLPVITEIFSMLNLPRFLVQFPNPWYDSFKVYKQMHVKKQQDAFIKTV